MKLSNNIKNGICMTIYSKTKCVVTDTNKNNSFIFSAKEGAVNEFKRLVRLYKIKKK